MNNITNWITFYILFYYGVSGEIAFCFVSFKRIVTNRSLAIDKL